jgi:hypothetical protein
MKSNKIKLSPALSRVIRRHYAGDYYLPHVDGMIRRYVNKEDSIREIKARYHEYFVIELARHANEPEKLANTKAWQLKMHNLIVDLKGLSHTDFDILTKLTTYETMPRKMKTINGRELILHKEE